MAIILCAMLALLYSVNQLYQWAQRRAYRKYLDKATSGGFAGEFIHEVDHRRAYTLTTERIFDPINFLEAYRRAERQHHFRTEDIEDGTGTIKLHDSDEATFFRVTAAVLRRLPLGTKFSAFLACVSIGTGIYTAGIACQILRTGSNLVIAVVAISASAFLVGVGARFWNLIVMPNVFMLLWHVSSKSGITDKFAAAIRMRTGDSITTIARERGFVNLIRGYCFAVRN